MLYVESLFVKISDNYWFFEKTRTELIVFLTEYTLYVLNQT